MMEFPEIDPTIFRIGSLEVRWYGVLYIVGFLLAYFFYKRFLRYRQASLPKDDYDNLLFYLMLGVVIGGRFGYVIFYNLPYYFQHPLHVFAVWQGGMSFHGGVLGVIVAGLIFARKQQISFYRYADPIMPLAALGLGLGRLGNFINGELYGRVTEMPWGMIFPHSDGQMRHPSQLYEAFLEGVLLFFITWLILRKSKTNGVVFYSWIGLYGLFRFIVEFFRQPDEHLGFILASFTMGQLLSFAMIIFALLGLGIIYAKNRKTLH
jgi:phosphatidylglycerol:prolipoprotein diacylglycerol transferase